MQKIPFEDCYTSGPTVASQVSGLPPLAVLLGVGESIAKPPLNLDHAGARLKDSNTPYSTVVVEDVVNESTVWKKIEKSLSLPALYRSREDLSLTLRMLRRVNFLKGLTEEDLMSVANFMKIESVSVQGYVLWEKSVPEPEVADSEEGSENEMDEVELLLSGLDSKGRLEKEGSRANADSPREKAASPSFSSSRYRSPTTLDEHSVVSASAVSSLPLVFYPEHPVRILVRGKVLLEIPTVNGMQHYPVLPLDTFGNELWTNALPVGSKYISSEPCTLVVLNPGDQKLNRVLARADRQMLEDQKRFLRDQLKVKIFESWLENDFERCAKSFVPLRLESFQVVVDEGELSDCVYFLKEGQLTVTRLVKPNPKKRRMKSKSSQRLDDIQSRVPSTSPLIRQIRDPSLTPNEHVMQVASMNPGEFFGELGLLAHDPDVRPGENIVWTDRYWTDALCHRFRQTDSVAEASLMKEIRGEGCATSPRSSADTERSERGNAEGNSNVDIRYPVSPTPRMATVYAQLPSLVYRVSFQDWRENVGGIALTRLLEYVKGYPAHDEIYEQFEKQLKWTVYRDEFIGDVLRQSKKDYQSEHLPSLKF